VFVPLHRRRAPGATGKPVRPARAAAVLSVVLGVLAAGLAANLFQGGERDEGDWLILGVAIAIGAAACGIAVARAIGRGGRS